MSLIKHFRFQMEQKSGEKLLHLHNKRHRSGCLLLCKCLAARSPFDYDTHCVGIITSTGQVNFDYTDTGQATHPAFNHEVISAFRFYNYTVVSNCFSASLISSCVQPRDKMKSLSIFFFSSFWIAKILPCAIPSANFSRSLCKARGSGCRLRTLASSPSFQSHR